MKIFCEIINILFNTKFNELKNNKNSFIRYNSEISEITKNYSIKSDVRIIWGGDNTIKTVKQFDTTLKRYCLF